jgi:hypothetical protein
MARTVLIACAIAGFVAMAQPVLADPPATPAVDHAQGATSKEQVPPPPSAWSSSSDVVPPINGLGKDVSPVGFGWG